jgi:ferredoxin
MRITVDWDTCESNGLCMVAAPEVFLLHDDDQLEVLQDSPDERLRPEVLRAVRSCPKQALSLED